MIPMSVMPEEEATTEAKDKVTLQNVECDGTDMEPITNTRYGEIINLHPLFVKTVQIVRHFFYQEQFPGC